MDGIDEGARSAFPTRRARHDIGRTNAKSLLSECTCLSVFMTSNVRMQGRHFCSSIRDEAGGGVKGTNVQ